MKARYADDIEDARAKQRARYHENPEKHRAASRAWQDANPEYNVLYLRRYYEEHRAEMQESQRQYYWDNVEKCRAACRAYREANREKCRAGVRDWHRRHPQVAKLQGAKYRMHLSQAENTLTSAQIDAILEVFDYRCGYCLTDLTELPKGSQTLDHMLPIVRGGGNTEDNVIPCCKRCNSRKKDRHIALMATYIDTSLMPQLRVEPTDEQI